MTKEKVSREPVVVADVLSGMVKVYVRRTPTYSEISSSATSSGFSIKNGVADEA